MLAGNSKLGDNTTGGEAEDQKGMALPEGSLVISNSSCKSGVCVPPSLEQGLTWRIGADAPNLASVAVYTSVEAFGKLGVLSIDFPGSSCPDSELDRALHESKNMLHMCVHVTGCVCCCYGL